MDLEQALQTFIAESRELLEDMERALLETARAGQQAETVNAIFRAAHTIKGSAGLFGLEAIVSFTHALESVLDGVRDGEVALSRELIELMLCCCDHIGALVDLAEARQETEAETLAPGGAALVARLLACMGTRQRRDADPPARQAQAPCQAAAPGYQRWHISLRFGPDVLRNGMDPLSFIRYLGTMGRIAGIAVLDDALPAPAAMDPESCYLGFEIGYDSAADRAAIEDVFEFVREDCRIRILPPGSGVGDYLRLANELPEENMRVAQLLERCGSIAAHELEAALVMSARDGAQCQQPANQSTVATAQMVPDSVPVQHRQSGEAKAHESRSVRVDADKLDRLIDLVGELIIVGASANLTARRARVPELQEATSQLSGLVEEVRNSALQLRMVKIGSTFNRFQRVVHDVAREIGKDIALVVSGEDTELDKTVVERIADPLTHLVRNAIDHGIEAAELRRARGKPARGTLRLNAYHDSGSIVIEVSDDGGGIRRDRILEKAVARGLVEPGRQLSDNEIHALIFEPGFSTAEQVTNLSGRGVGMDVVKRNIGALRGSVDIRSAEGIGTTITVRLPLTLAIINGFLVGLGKSVFVIPLDMIEECVEFSAEPGHDYTNLRGQVLPFIRLRELFSLGGTPPRRESIVVVRHAGQKAGLVVDSLLGEFQTVIKPLGRVFNELKCISGSTILGSGEVALILDIAAVLSLLQRREQVVV